MLRYTHIPFILAWNLQIDADADPVPDPAHKFWYGGRSGVLFGADADPGYQKDADPSGSGSTTLPMVVSSSDSHLSTLHTLFQTPRRTTAGTWRSRLARRARRTPSRKHSPSQPREPRTSCHSSRRNKPSCCGSGPYLLHRSFLTLFLPQNSAKKNVIIFPKDRYYMYFTMVRSGSVSGKPDFGSDPTRHHCFWIRIHNTGKRVKKRRKQLLFHGCFSSASLIISPVSQHNSFQVYLWYLINSLPHTPPPPQ